MTDYADFNNEAAELTERQLAERDWYEAYATAVHDIIHKAWPDELTEAENKQAEEYADSVAIRPECEK